MSSTPILLAQGITDSGLRAAGALIGGGLALAGGAIGAANGDALVGAATINGIARQPEAQARLCTTMFLIIAVRGNRRCAMITSDQGDVHIHDVGVATLPEVGLMRGT